MAISYSPKRNLKRRKSKQKILFSELAVKKNVDSWMQKKHLLKFVT